MSNVQSPTPVAPAAPYPVRLEADLEPSLSRWLWLVTWVLLIPHVVVLAALWVVYVVLSVVALVAIVATGRYPRGIFGFVLGLERWAFRVAAYASLMTDVYPPFRLDQGGREPAPSP